MITRESVEHIAKLARLEFTDTDYDKLTGEMNTVIGYIDQLSELDVTGVAPLENINESVETNILRPDIAKESLTSEQALSNAPKSADGFFLVPKVIEQQKTATIITDEEEEYD